MSKEHEKKLKKCCYCDECGTYCVTRYLLEVRNNKEHNLDDLDENFSAAESESSEHECQQCPLKCTNFTDLQEHIKEHHVRKNTKKKQKNKKK